MSNADPENINTVSVTIEDDEATVETPSGVYALPHQELSDALAELGDMEPVFRFMAQSIAALAELDRGASIN